MSPTIRKKEEKFTFPSKYLLFILTALCCVLMLITFVTDIFNRPFNSVAGYVVVPFQEGIGKTGEWIYDRSQELIEIQSLIEENEDLKNQVAELTSQNTILQQEHYELETLRGLMELSEQYSDYTSVGARVISKDTSNWYTDFTIDKGYNDGLCVDMNVMADGGLVGRITQVGPNWSTVTSIISDNSNVSASVLSTGDNLIVSGNLQLMSKGQISFSQLMDEDDTVCVGDKVVTSNISDKYLPGILVGYIYDIEEDSNNLTKSGQITPAVDFAHLDTVLVITQLKQQISESDDSE